MPLDSDLVSGSLSGERYSPNLKKVESMSKKETETMEQVQLSHETIVRLVKELDNGFNMVQETETLTKDEIKKLKDRKRQVSKSVFGRVPQVSYMVNQATSKGITTIKKVSEDSAVSMSTISRYDWIGSTLQVVGLTKTSEKLASKSLNLLIQGILKKEDMLKVQDIDTWKQVIEDRTFKVPNAPKISAVKDSIMNGAYDDELDSLVTTIETRRKMMIKA